MSTIDDHAHTPTLDELEQRSRALLALADQVADPAWLRQRSLDELTALIETSLATLTTLWPLVQPTPPSLE